MGVFEQEIEVVQQECGHQVFVLIYSLPGSERGVTQLHQAEHVLHRSFLVVTEGVVPQPRTGLVQAETAFQEALSLSQQKILLGFHDGFHPPVKEFCVELLVVVGFVPVQQ